MICPKCNREITNLDTLETEWYKGKYYDYMMGSCDKCETVYTWTEIYIHDHDEDIKEFNAE